MPTTHQFIEVMAKHLPPSATTLSLLDVGAVTGAVLSARRADLKIESVSLITSDWVHEANSVDAVVAYDLLLQPDFLAAVLYVMRPGGRLIVVNPANHPDVLYVRQLEQAGYIRILVEPALADADSGVLIRGEKPHITSDTLTRVQSIASRDADVLDFDQFRGRYVHLLVQQLPNKPVWQLQPDEQLEWRAVGVWDNDVLKLLAFSSLPKAVGFMQTAVVQGYIQDVNKIGKFSKQTAQAWIWPILLNPTLEQLKGQQHESILIDAQTAEAPDE